MNNNKSTTRQQTQTAIDPFRLVAAFLIVAIHTAPLSTFSETADFLFSYCFARIAVPFFLMTTGYFVLSPLISKKSGSMNPRPLVSPYKRFWKSMKKTALLYLGATALYLPVNIYSGKLPGLNDIFKVLVFDGTFYHLWYLPATLLGMLLLFLLFKRCSSRILMPVCVTLYLIGLLGDSWYGLVSKLPPVKSFYDVLFSISSYTRNGFFYAPVFLLMGAVVSHRRIRRRFDTVMINLTGTLFFLLLMLGEGFLSFHLEWQRHNSMYLFLIPCMYFLFRLLLCLPGKGKPMLRQATLWIYILHPLVIILIRGFAKLTRLTPYLVENSLIHYLAVCAASFILALAVTAFSPVLAALATTIWKQKLPRKRR